MVIGIYLGMKIIQENLQSGFFIIIPSPPLDLADAVKQVKRKHFSIRQPSGKQTTGSYNLTDHFQRDALKGKVKGSPW